MDGKQHLIAGSALAIASLVVLAWWRSGRGPERTEPRAPLAVPETSRAAELEPATAPREERVPVAPESREAARVVATPSPSTLAEIRGRFVFADGSPAAAVRWDGHGYRTPEDWKDPSGTTGADGRFSIRFDPPRAFQFTLEAKLAGFAGVKWSWDMIKPGAKVDVGEVELVVGATLEGRIVDRAGNALVGQGWFVYARSVGRREWDGRDETQVFVVVDSRTARFRAEDVMPGKVELSVHSDMASFQGPPLTLESGETRTMDLVYDGPDNTRRISVTTHSEPFYLMNCPEPESIRLHGPGGEVRSAEGTTDSSQTRSFDDLPDGSYTVTIDDPYYLPWSSRSLRPGESVSAKLEGSSALTLSVLDEDGKAVEDFALTVEFRNVNFSPREFDVDHERGLVRGMFAGDYTVRVTAGMRLGTLEVDGLLPGETRAVTVRLGETCTLTGRVVHRDGTPVAGPYVRLLRPAQIDDSASSRVLTKNSSSSDPQRMRKEVASATCDDSGTFRFAVPGPGAYVVQACDNTLSATSEVLELFGHSEGLEVVLPRGGRLRGRLHDAVGLPWEGFRVALAPHDKSLHQGISSASFIRASVVPVAPDGSFEVGPLPAGDSTVRLQFPDRNPGGGLTVNLGSGQVLGTVTLEEGAVVERVFEVSATPGTLALVVSVNGEPGVGLRVQLNSSTGNLIGETDALGVFGPRKTFAAAWGLQVQDSVLGWRYFAPGPIVNEPAADTRLRVTIEVAEARLELVDSRTGAALAGRKVALFDEHDAAGQVRTTDAEGALALALTPGVYTLMLDPGATPFLREGEDTRRATLTWSTTGPLAERVSL